MRITYPASTMLIALLVLASLNATTQVRPAAAPQAATNAAWITAAGPTDRPDHIYVRQPLRLSDAPESAALRIAGRGSYSVYVNGGLIVRGSGDVAQNLFVTRYLAKGPDVLAIDCENRAGPAAILFELTIHYRSGRTALVVSNGRERASRLRTPGWHTLEFDDRTWPVSVVAGRPSPPGPLSQKQERGSLAPAQSAIRNPGRLGPATLGPPQSAIPFDYSRLVRQWDLTAGGRDSENPLTRRRDPGDRMVLSTGMASTAEMPLLASTGFTLLETSSDYLSTDETSPGVWSYGRQEGDLRLSRQYGFDWTYFPHFAFPPKWYRDQVDFTRIQCLEHQQPAQAFSPWEPKFTATINRGYRSLADRLGGPEGLSALYLGVHGDFGEAGLLSGARMAVPALKEDWQRRFGDTHDHLGWWCDDPLARRDFRDKMLRKYRDLDGVNSAWKTRFRGADEIHYPASPTEGSRRWWLDFAHWYLGSVTDLSDTVMGVARRTFPDRLLMLPLGFADENPRGGNDTSALAKIAADRHVELRSTHGAYHPFAQNQATQLGRIASAASFYGVPLWIESSGPISADQEVGRIFASASTGSTGFYEWPDNVRANRDVFYRYGRYLQVEKPVVDVAMFFPTTAHLLRGDSGYPPILEKGCTDIRDVLNYDIVDERMIHDGALDRYRMLVMWEGSVVEQDALEKIRDWVQAGGVVAAYDFGKIENVEGDRGWFTDLFGYAGKLRPAAPAVRFSPEGVIPARYRIPVGDPAAAQFLEGGWGAAETASGVARRWAMSGATVRLPFDPSRRYSLIVRASFPRTRIVRPYTVSVNGVRVGELDTGEETTYAFSVPAAALDGGELAMLTFRSTATPAPSEPELRVAYVQLEPAGGPPPTAEPGLPQGRFEQTVDQRRLKSDWARPYGRGWTVYYPARRNQLSDYYEIVRYLTYHLSDLDNTKRDAIAVDDAWDGMYATLLTDKILYYNPTGKPITRTVNLSAAEFARRRDVQPPLSMTNTITVGSHEIGAIRFTDAPQELLFQCEGFRGLAPLHASTGEGFSPGQGYTHVLIPVGGSISTRIQVEAAGRYHVFYRAIRRGIQAQAEVSIDGRALSRPDHTSPPSPAGVEVTLLAGTVDLSRGVHTLVLRPRRGEDIRADFVLFSTDQTVSGYGFAVKPPPPR